MLSGPLIRRDQSWFRVSGVTETRRLFTVQSGRYVYFVLIFLFKVSPENCTSLKKHTFVSI